jgi:L-fuconolactonase
LIAHYQPFSTLKGFRHVLQDEPRRDFMLRSAFRRGISKRARFGYTYDLLIFMDSARTPIRPFGGAKHTAETM